MAQPLLELALALALAAAAAIAPAINVPNAPAGQSAGRATQAVVARTVNAVAESLSARRNGRGKFGKAVAVRVLDGAALRTALGKAPRTAPVVDSAAESALLQHLGLGGGEQPLAAPAEVSGHYDLPTRTVLVADWVDLEAGRFALSRDAALAVLDRRFDLKRWLQDGQRGGRQNSDGMLARQAVAEGDATTQALEQLEPQGTVPSPRALGELSDRLRVTVAAESAGAPPLALGRRLFTTLDGLGFVAALRARLPWSAVDRVWRDPPRSSEQILHLEKYQRGEQPDDVGARLPARPRGGWRITFADTLGELGTRIFLERAIDPYRAERAAAGWGGDRALWLRAGASGRKSEGEGEGFAAWVTTWDDDSDADDFAAEAAAALAVLARVTPAEARPQAGKFRVVDGAGRVFALERRQRAVGLLFSAPPGAEAALADLTAAAARGGRRVAARPRPAGR